MLGGVTSPIRPAGADGDVYVLGYRGSPHVQDYRDFLDRNGVANEWIDVEHDPLARFLGAPEDLRGVRLPVFLFADGSRLEPFEDTDASLAFHRTRAELAERLGMHTRPAHDLYDVLILGAGPAGLTAALTAASEGLRTVVVERHVPGGQAGMSSRIENYPGFPNGLSGRELAEAAYTQAVQFGAEFVVGADLDRFHFEGPQLALSLVNGAVMHARSGIGATGFTYRRLDAPGVDELLGAGVYYGVSPSDAVYHSGGDVFVVGGANSAGQAALHLAMHARSVTLLIRGESIYEDMSHYLAERCIEHPAISIRTRTRVLQASGETGLEAIAVVDDSNGERTTLDADALFVLIGGKPTTHRAAGLLRRDPHGFIMTGPDVLAEGADADGASVWPLDRDPYFLESSRPGIFMAGDVRLGSIKRVASAVGEGVMAVQFVHRYLAGLDEGRSVGRRAA
jgi:thioredoxin reductase (NADPH)